MVFSDCFCTASADTTLLVPESKSMPKTTTLTHSLVSLRSTFYSSFFPPLLNPLIAPSTPEAHLATLCKLHGSTCSMPTHCAYNGKLTSPLTPSSTIFTISRANSTASTTGPKNELGVFTPSKSLVPSCPGVTSTILTFSAPAGAFPAVNSARSEACSAIRPALAAA